MVVKHTQQNDDVIYQLMRFVKNTIIYTQFYLYPIKAINCATPINY